MFEKAVLEGKLALVTGAASGIGKATVSALLAAGASVLAFDHAADRMEEAAAAWAAGDQLRTFVGDVTDPADVASSFDAVRQFGRPLAAVVTCAGIQSHSPIQDMSDREWHRVLQVNLTGVFSCCRAAARAMIPQRSGSIVTLSSDHAFTGVAGRAHYAASKGAVCSLTRSLALELAPHGIRVNAVSPGAIDTPLPRALSGRTERDVQLLLGRNPLARIGSAEDVANLILFLLSPQSAHITGQVVHINGGDLMP